MNEMENQTWKREISWIKAHAGHNGNELADQNSKEAATTAILIATIGSPRIE